MIKKNKCICSIFFIFTLILISLISAQEFYYDLKMYYEKENIEIRDIKIIYSQNKILNYPGNYILKTKNTDILNEYGFGVPNTIIYDDWDESGNQIKGETAILENVSFRILIPYEKNIKEILIYNENKEEINKKDVSKFSNNFEKIVIEKRESEIKIYEGGKEFSYIKIILIAIIVLIVFVVCLIGNKYLKI